MKRPSEHKRSEDHDTPEPKRRAFQCETPRENQSPESGKDDTQNCAKSIESDDLDWNDDGAKSDDPAPFDSIQKSDSVSRESDKTEINDRGSYDIQPDIQERDHTDRENNNSESGDTDGYDTELDDADCRIGTPRAFLSPEQIEIAQAIFPNVFNKVQTIILYAKCGPLPANIIPPQKRIRIEGSPDSTTNDKVEMYYLFACPFYRHDPARYEECINRHILESIKNVQQHLQKSHREPPYCPICKTEFTGASIRDNHTRKRSCEVRERCIDGINNSSMRKVCDKNKDHIEDGEEKRWYRMWKIAFPNLPAPRPYLDVGAGLWISIGFEYWSERGCLLVSEELRRLEHETTPNHNLEVLRNAPEAAALLDIILSWILNELWGQRHFPEPRPLSLDD